MAFDALKRFAIAALLCLGATEAHAQASCGTVQQCTAASSVNASDQIFISQSGVTKRATVSQIQIGGGANPISGPTTTTINNIPQWANTTGSSLKNGLTPSNVSDSTVPLAHGAFTPGNLIKANDALGTSVDSGLSPPPFFTAVSVSLSLSHGTTTWTKPPNVTFVSVYLCGAGGGGGDGQTGTTGTVAGGTGGGGGACVFNTYLASILSNTVSVTVGLSGGGGIPGVRSNGLSGGNSTFGNGAAQLIAYGGGGGEGAGCTANAPAGGGGGGLLGAGTSISTCNSSPSAGGTLGGGGSTNSATGSSPSMPTAGAGGGGAPFSGSSFAGGAAGWGGGGGGGGGGGTAATTVGGAGGVSLGAPTGGSAGSGSGSNGGNGNSPQPTSGSYLCGSGGGGGGGSSTASTNAGSGGNGGQCAGGGAGGSANGGTTANGGNGGDGLAMIIAE